MMHPTQFASSSMANDQHEHDLEPGSITRLIARLKTGPDDEAAQAIWERYFDQVLQIARRKLNASSSERDADDVASTALYGLFRRFSTGRITHVEDRFSLWNLLSLLLKYQISEEVKRRRRPKRLTTKRFSEIADAADDARWEDTLAEKQPTGDDAAKLMTMLSTLVDALPPDLQRIASAKISGSADQEVAQQEGVTPRTIQRRLKLIREHWMDMTRK
jgi:RNA polymerase sigma factor (sigma-70 family)